MDAEACTKSYGKRTLLGGDKFSEKLEEFKKTVSACVRAARKDGFIHHDATRPDVLLVLNGFMKDLEGTYSSWPMAFEFWRAYLNEELGDLMKSQAVDISKVGNAIAPPNVDIVLSLEEQAFSGRARLRQMLVEIGFDGALIRELELVYFSSSVITYIYFTKGRQIGREDILDQFAMRILSGSSSLFNSGESIHEAVAQYRARYLEYGKLLDLLFSGSDDAGSPNLLASRVFERVTGLSSAMHSIAVQLSESFLFDFIVDQLNCIEEL
jgi:hypothetical protein